MIDLDMTLFIQVINFLVTAVVLNFLLIKPIRDIISKRNAVVETQLEKIEKFNNDAVKKMSSYEESLSEARKEGALIRSTISEQSHKEEQEILAEASKKSTEELHKIQKQLNSQESEVLLTLSMQVEVMAEKVAKKILGKVL